MSDTLSLAEIVSLYSVADILAEQKRQVKAGVMAAYGEHGFTKPGRNGDVAKDKTAVGRVIRDALIEDSRIEEYREKQDSSMTRGRMAQVAFPNAKGADGKLTDLTEVELEIWSSLIGDVWSLAADRADGVVQELLKEVDPELWLCHTKVSVDGSTEDEVVACYVTSSDELIEEDFFPKFRNRSRSSAEAMAENLGELGKRKKSMRALVESTLEGVMQDSTDLAKSKLALTMGSKGKKKDD